MPALISLLTPKRLRLLRKTALEAIDTTTAALSKLLTCVDWMAHTTCFNCLLFHCAWNHEDRPACGAGCLSVFVHRWVNSGLHSWEIVHKK